MGGGSRSQTVGFRYFVDQEHMLCQGPADAVTRIAFDDLEAYRGEVGSRGLAVNEPGLFGGESREGGIAGTFSIRLGGVAQAVNAYMASKIGSLLSASRGLVTVVLEDVEIGTVPRLKSPHYDVRRILKRSDGSDQWEPGLAAIFADFHRRNAVWISYNRADPNGDVGDVGFQTALYHLDMARVAVDAGQVLDIGVTAVTGDTGESLSFVRASLADIDTLAAFVDARREAFGNADATKFVDAAVPFFAASAAEGMDNRAFVLISQDGARIQSATVDAAVELASDLVNQGSGVFTRAARTAVDCYAIRASDVDNGILVRFDNTSFDGIPRSLPGGVGNRPGNPEDVIQTVRGVFGGRGDMNPAHIIREVLTDQRWGTMRIPEGQIGASFKSAAEAFVAERTGLSIAWDRESTSEEFLEEIATHCGAVIFTDRRSGLWEIKLLRRDFDPASLLTLTDADIVEFGSDLERVDPAEAVNAITVEFTDHVTRETTSRTLQLNSQINLTGAPRSETIRVRGIHSEPLAARVALRELRARAAGVASGTITCTRAADPLNPGDPFILHAPRLGFNAEIMRVVEIEERGGVDHRLRVKFISDVEDLEDIVPVLVGSPEPLPSTAPTAADRRVIEEAPLWTLVQLQGDATVDVLLSEDVTLGNLHVGISLPSGPFFNADLYLDAGAGDGFVQVDAFDFAPSAALSAALTSDPGDVTVGLADVRLMSLVAVGDLGQIGGEIVRIDAISASEVTLGRGCLDTVPEAHSAGAGLVIWGARPQIDVESYNAGEAVSAKVLPVSSRGRLGLDLAPVDQVTFDSRAYRPFPAGAFRINGSYAPPLDAADQGDLALSWAHRSRLDQTAPAVADYAAGNIGPEAGVGYRVRADYEGLDGAVISTPVDRSVGQATADTVLQSELPPPAGAEVFLRVQVIAERDGLQSRVSRSYRLTIPGGAAFGWGLRWGEAWGGLSGDTGS